MERCEASAAARIHVGILCEEHPRRFDALALDGEMKRGPVETPQIVQWIALLRIEEVGRALPFAVISGVNIGPVFQKEFRDLEVFMFESHVQGSATITF